MCRLSYSPSVMAAIRHRRDPWKPAHDAAKAVKTAQRSFGFFITLLKQGVKRMANHN